MPHHVASQWNMNWELIWELNLELTVREKSFIFLVCEGKNVLVLQHKVYLNLGIAFGHVKVGMRPQLPISGVLSGELPTGEGGATPVTDQSLTGKSERRGEKESTTIRSPPSENLTLNVKIQSKNVRNCSNCFFFFPYHNYGREPN